MASFAISFNETGAQACYPVSGTDLFVMGHYPGNPIFPGVLILHMLIELAEAVSGRQFGVASTTLIKRVQYLKATVPGDILDLAVTIKAHTDGIMTILATAGSDGVISTRATIECQAICLPDSAHA